jgi:hypothetical protein
MLANGSAPLYWLKPVKVVENGRVSVKLAVPPEIVLARTIDSGKLTKQTATAECSAILRRRLTTAPPRRKLHVCLAFPGYFPEELTAQNFAYVSVG